MVSKMFKRFLSSYLMVLKLFDQKPIIVFISTARKREFYSLTVTVIVLPLGSSNLSMVVMLASMLIPKNKIAMIIRLMRRPIQIGTVKNSTQSQTLLVKAVTLEMDDSL